jgi:hypothetical protein
MLVGNDLSQYAVCTAPLPDPSFAFPPAGSPWVGVYVFVLTQERRYAIVQECTEADGSEGRSLRMNGQRAGRETVR